MTTTSPPPPPDDRPDDAAPVAPEKGAPTRWLGRLSGPARLALVALAAVAILFLFVFPAQSLLGQRHDVNNTKHEVQVLRDQNAQLEEEAARLRTVSEIERLAREQYHMVFPGEKPFAVVPTPPTTAARTSPSTTPTTTP